MEIKAVVEKIRKWKYFPNRRRVKLARAALGERMRGLDFSLPDHMYDRGRNDAAMYAASSVKALQELFSCIDTGTFDKILDIGCGKGFVLWQARVYGFSKVGGVEYDQKLYDTCLRNMERLGLQNQVDVHYGNACDFDGYGDYNVFYFFNPFVAEVMEKVMRAILGACSGKEIMLVYYRPRYCQIVERAGCFERVKVLFDKEKNYEIYLYRGKVP